MGLFRITADCLTKRELGCEQIVIGCVPGTAENLTDTVPSPMELTEKRHVNLLTIYCIIIIIKLLWWRKRIEDRGVGERGPNVVWKNPESLLGGNDACPRFIGISSTCPLMLFFLACALHVNSSVSAFFGGFDNTSQVLKWKCVAIVNGLKINTMSSEGKFLTN